MNRSLKSVPLQHENGGSSHRSRIILDNNSTAEPSHYIAHGYIIFGKFVIAMVGNTDGAARSESPNLSESFDQWPKHSRRQITQPPRSPRVSVFPRSPAPAPVPETRRCISAAHSRCL